jgi:hypothetical protein
MNNWLDNDPVIKLCSAHTGYNIKYQDTAVPVIGAINAAVRNQVSLMAYLAAIASNNLG